jgi:hypothetical protein
MSNDSATGQQFMLSTILLTVIADPREFVQIRLSKRSDPDCALDKIFSNFTTRKFDTNILYNTYL